MSEGTSQQATEQKTDRRGNPLPAQPAPAEGAAKPVTWMERRPIAGANGRALEPYEYQIVTGTTVPPGGIQVDDSIPVCGWTVGRQWLVNAGPVNFG